MQQQMQQQQSQQAPQHRSSLLSLLQTTYKDTNTSKIMSAQSTLISLIDTDPSCLDQLFTYLHTANNDPNLRKSCSNLLKKYYYKISQNKNIKKQKYLKQAYQILVDSRNNDYAVKQNVGIAVENILNHDLDGEYRNGWVQHVKMQMFGLIQNVEGWTLGTLEVMHGLVIFCYAIFNSFVEPEEKIGFINMMLPALTKSASLCAQIAKDNIGTTTITPKSLFTPQLQIFQLLQHTIQTLLQQQQLIPSQLTTLLTSQSLSNIYLEYLYLFPLSNKTMLTKYQTLNQLKIKILNIFYMIFTHQFCQQILDISKYEEFCNINIVSYVFETFANQCAYMDQDNEDDTVEEVVCKVIGVVEKIVARRVYEEFFQGFKIQILFALLSYCRTAPRELEDLYEEPDKFADTAQQFSQSFPASPLVKIRASNLLKTFINNIDQALSNVVQLCVVFITGSLHPQQQDSQILKLAKQAYSNFSFMNYTSRQKLDVSLMILTVISQQLQKRQDLKSVIISIFMTNSRTIHQITDQLVLARLIHFIGYYPNSLYFNMIKQLMFTQRIYLIQGLRCFDRIARNKLYLQAFPHMHLVFNSVAELIQVGDPVFQHLVFQHCQTVLRKSYELYCAVLTKIQNCFKMCITDMNISSNKQKSIQCLNYLQHLLQSQKNQTYLQSLQQTYLTLQPLGLQHQILQQNYLSIYSSLIKKSITLPPQISSFIVKFSSLDRLQHYSNYSLYFLLVNNFVLKSDEEDVLGLVFGKLGDFVAGLGEGGAKANFGVLPQVGYVMGHILLCARNKTINHKFVQYLGYLSIKKQQIRTHFTYYQQWLTFLLLHYFYINASLTCTLLQQNKQLTTFMLTVFNTKCNTKIQRKVSVLAMLEILMHEEDSQLRLEIFRYCVKVLNQQKNAYFGKSGGGGKPGGRRDRKGRQGRMEDGEMSDGVEGRQKEEEERMENQAIKNKDEDMTLFKDFKHPFDKICQFSMFKHKVYSFAATKQINQQSVPGISQILQYQWHNNNIRRVFRTIKHQQQ